MKKNLILGSIAFTFAIGSAYASMFAVTTFVKQNPTGPNTPPNCKNIGAWCETTGSADCIVEVTNTTNGQTVQRVGYQAGCVTPLKSNGVIPTTATITF